MTKRPFLLITNDDGIHAPGIKHLWEAVHDFADVAIVAPATEKSGSGLSITWTKPLHLHPVQWDKNTPAWSLSGTPADCVKMALAVALEKMPDMIISGVNRGSNAGGTVLYSGTIGGVIEVALRGIQGIAFSFSDLETPPVSVTQKYITSIIQHFLQNPLASGSLLNVNFPYNCKDRIKGFRIARQGKSRWQELPDRRLHPEGLPYYWLGGTWGATDESSESDVTLLEEGYIAATPIHVGELTCEASYKEHKNLTEDAFTLNDELIQPESSQ